MRDLNQLPPRVTGNSGIFLNRRETAIKLRIQSLYFNSSLFR